VPLDQLHDDEVPARILSDVVNRADVGMVERGGGPSLALEALHGLGIPGSLVGQKLDRDTAAEAGVFAAVDDSHAPAAQLGQDLVVGNGAPDHLGVCPRALHTRPDTSLLTWTRLATTLSQVWVSKGIGSLGRTSGANLTPGRVTDC